MKEKNKKCVGIYINKKIPKLKDNENRFNKYHNSIELQFEGKAYLVKDEKNEELENNSKFNKQGKHLIKFINKDNEIFYINIEIKKISRLYIFLISLFIILGLTILSNNHINRYIINKFSDFEIDLKGIKYVFDIDYENTNFKNIELTDKVSGSDFICPGSYGEFFIEINTYNGNKDMTYSMKVEEEKNKPQNLKFKTNGKVYNSMEELARNINGIIEKNECKVIKIEWFWDYETENDDISDTNDGENLNSYRVLISMIGDELIKKGENNE